MSLNFVFNPCMLGKLIQTTTFLALSLQFALFSTMPSIYALYCTCEQNISSMFVKAIYKLGDIRAGSVLGEECQCQHHCCVEGVLDAQPALVYSVLGESCLHRCCVPRGYTVDWMVHCHVC